MTQRHTPEPWTAKAFRASWRVQSPHGTVAIIDQACLNQEEKARLIAAAPEMLAELKSLTDRLANYEKFPKREQEIYIKTARSAIAKAEGRET